MEEAREERRFDSYVIAPAYAVLVARKNAAGSPSCVRTSWRYRSAFVGWLGVDCYAEDLGEVFFDAIFEGCCDVVDVCDLQIAGHRAVAGDQDFVVDAADVDFVAVGDFGVFRLK